MKVKFICPVDNNGLFVHRSLIEYFIAREIYEQVINQ
jgi:hypothetical protein